LGWGVLHAQGSQIMTVGLAGDVPPSFVFKISRYCQELVLDRINPTMQGVMSSCVEYRCDKMWSNESEYVVSDGDDIYPAETLASISFSKGRPTRTAGKPHSSTPAKATQSATGIQHRMKRLLSVRSKLCHPASRRNGETRWTFITTGKSDDFAVEEGSNGHDEDPVNFEESDIYDSGFEKSERVMETVTVR